MTMKQILQHLRNGQLEVAVLPSPHGRPGSVLIRTQCSLISAGTERMLVEFSKANLLQKTRQQPEKVKQVLDKIRTDGLAPTLEAVFRKLDEPLPLGYCNVGHVADGCCRSSDVRLPDLSPGDRVVSNGPHAEVVCVPRNLTARIPDDVTDEQAAFTVLGAIALQGIRLADPTLGERFVVFGLGLIGLLTVQLLRANGCEVLGVDLNPERLAMAERFGAAVVDARNSDPVKAAQAWTSGVGVDGTLITASAKTDAIVHQAAESCRKRGRIVLVGVVGLNLRRTDFYEKELTFQVSCSYGPGRYDDNYEQKGQDYPIGFVRWSEQRNFEAILRLMASGRLDVEPLITDRFKLDDAVRAYEKIQNDPGALGVLLEYPGAADRAPRVRIEPQKDTSKTSGPSAACVSSCRTGKRNPVVGVVGAGGFAKGVLLPALAKTDAELRYVADIEPPAAQHAAQKYAAHNAITDHRLILDDAEVDAVFIVVGHHLHGRFVCEALEAGKHVFVEKPLAMNRNELTQVAEAVAKSKDRHLMVGFNRRFSTHTAKIKQLIAGHSEPLCMSITVNAGFIPRDHWIQDPERGGGRIIGEGCHFIDLLACLAESPVTTVSAMMVGDRAVIRGDKMTIALGFGDGSVGTINYFANGSKSYPKEMLEVFSDGRVLKMENFRVTRGYGFKGFRRYKTWRQDKGHREGIAAFLDRISLAGEPLISFDQLENTTLASIAAVESANTGKTLAP